MGSESNGGFNFYGGSSTSRIILSFLTLLSSRTIISYVPVVSP